MLGGAVKTSGPLSFGATAISIAPLAAVGVILVYGATAIARWSDRSLIFGIVGVASGAPLVLLGLILKFGIPDSPSDVAEAARPFLSAGGVLLVVGAVLIDDLEPASIRNPRATAEPATSPAGR